MSSAYPFLLWWSWECVLCLIIIIKPEVWIINHCLGLGHETMVCAVCLTMFLWNVFSKYHTKPGVIIRWLLISLGHYEYSVIIYITSLGIIGYQIPYVLISIYFSHLHVRLCWNMVGRAVMQIGGYDAHLNLFAIQSHISLEFQTFLLFQVSIYIHTRISDLYKTCTIYLFIFTVD